MPDIDDRIQVSALGDTVWVHQFDGSTVGRFSKRFGMDVHNTVSDQLQGLPQCLNCTHQPATEIDWIEFCRLMLVHFGIEVPVDLIEFTGVI